MRKASVALVVGTGLLLASCSSTSQEQADGSFSNCGLDFDLQQPLNSVVTIEQGATDTVLALGAADKMVGYGHQKEELPPELEEVPEVSPEIPTFEQVLEVEPELVYSPFASVFTADQVGSREEYKDLGIVTFLPNSECLDVEDNAEKNQFELLEKDFQQLGELLGIDPQPLIEEQNSALEQAAAESLPEDLDAAVLYSFYDGAPYIGGRASIFQDMTEVLGINNVFEDVEEAWPELSWEAIADRDPDVIVLADLSSRGAPGDSWQEKVEALESDPATSQLSAVQNGQYVVVSASGLSPAATSMETLTELYEGLRNLLNEN